MAHMLIDDRFSPAHASHDKKRTTRFYGIKFIETKMNDNKHSKSPSCGQITLLNPRQYFREVYGPFLCTLLVTSVLTIILGASLALAGYYVPRLTIDSLMEDKITEEEAIVTVLAHDKTIHSLRVAGVVLLTVGGIGLFVLILTPLIFLHRSDYQALPSSTPTSQARVTNNNKLSNRTDPKLHYTVIKQHIQPRKQSRPSKKFHHHHRPSYDQGFLSPELNRGPIFVSDETRRIGDRKQGRFDIDVKLKSDMLERSRSASYTKGLEPDFTRTPVKAGSFHCLH